jgi:hypothetical protein
MRQLRYVGPGDDGDHVILETADGGEQFVLYVTTALRDAIRTDLPRLHHVEPPPPAPSISPREIQVRVRAGADPATLADEHDVTLERVLRFAGPVLEERHRVADEARRARARRSTTEGQSVIFGEAVDSRFAAHGIDPYAVTWDAYRRLDGQWVVTAGWVGGGTEPDARTAEWSFNLTARTVAPLDDTAAELLSDRPVRPFTSRTADTEATRPVLAAAPSLGAGVVAFPTLAGVPAEEFEGAADDVFDQDALEDDPRHLVQDPGDAVDESAEFDAPPLPLRLADAPSEDDADDAGHEDDDLREPTAPLPRLKNLGVAGRDEVPRGRNGKPQMPSWDDIMLGVRRTTD